MVAGLVFTFSSKREIRHSHVVVVQRRARKCTKKCDARAKLLFSLSNLFLFLPCSLPSPSSLGSFSNDDGDSNQNVKKSKGLDWQNNNFARASLFFVPFFAVTARLRREKSLISYFMEDVNKGRRTFPSLSKLKSGLQENSFKEILLHLTFSAIWKSLKKREFILKVTFSRQSPSSMLKLPVA